MGSINWAEYYDKFYDWSESTQISRLSSVRDFGPACEVCEIAEEFCDEKIASRLIRKALAAGVKFSSDDISNLEGVVTDELFMELAQSLGGAMSWELFYDHFYDWNTSTQRSNAIAQKQFGLAQEVIDIAIELPDKDSATKLLSNAHAAGVRFSAEEILQLDGTVPGRMIAKLAMDARDPLSAEDLDDISYLLSDTEIEKVAKKHGITILLLSKGWSVPWGKTVQDEIYHKKEVMRKIEQKAPLTENDMLYLELAVTERNDYLDKDNGLEVDGSKASIRKKGICILRNMARVLGIDLLLVT